MTRLITKALYNGTKQEFAFSGNTVEEVLKKAQKDRIARNATVFLFFNRKTGKLVDSRFN